VTHKTTSLFAQIIHHLIDLPTFERIIRAHRGEKHSKGFRCWDQFVAMLFLQLSGVTSLREIVGGLKSVAGKVSHLRLNKVHGHTTLAYANEHRPWEIYRDLFFSVLTRSQQTLRVGTSFRFKNKLLSMDSSLVSLCLSLFPWARYRQKKGGVKVHCLLDHDGYFPEFAHITDGKTSDSRIARLVLLKLHRLSAGSIIVFDRAYVDFKLFVGLCADSVFFVTRLKEGMNWRVIRHHPLPQHRNIVRDDEIAFEGVAAKVLGQLTFRIVAIYDETTGETMTFLTNNFNLGSTTIARIYKDRWQIEIFFKTLKQHLKIKTFVGVSENALHIQIWTAMIAVLAMKYLKALSTFGWSLSNLVAFLRLNLFTYRDLLAWLNQPFAEPPWEPSMQLAFEFRG
jgi:hypothetical protein